MIVSALLRMVSSILEGTGQQSESLLDQLENLMRKLEGEATAHNLNAARGIDRSPNCIARGVRQSRAKPTNGF